MKKRRMFLTALALIGMVAGADASQLTHIQRQILQSDSPEPVAASFSFDFPEGPVFSDAQKDLQREKGRAILPLIKRAFEGGAAEVRIPPGDYRFGQERYEGAKTIFPLGFEDMQRSPEHTFEIDARGVTFWFDLEDNQMPPGHRCVGFRNCRNIVLHGGTIDRGTRGCVEGRITQIDREQNRFEIEPSPGVIVPLTYRGGEEQRLLPFKSDGRFCAPLYDLQPGIRRLRYNRIVPSEQGRYWVTMEHCDLMDRIHDSNWEVAYGDLGVLRVGDGLCCLYTSAGAITLEDCANITIYGVNVYVTKGGATEMGGDGAHLWKDCYFGPRPGTSQWKGADGYLCRSTRYGCTMDHVTIRHTADDVSNFHGVWGRVAAASGCSVWFEQNPALRPTLRNARSGDRLRFINRRTGRFLGEAVVKELFGFQIKLDRDATPFSEAQAEWMDHECAGWVIQNCLWEDNFQRLLIMSGPGTVSACRFTRMGSNISLNTGMGLVGGIPRDISILNNTFTDVSQRPLQPVIEARAHNAKGEEGFPPIERLMVLGNTFSRGGGAAMNLTGIRESRIEDNRIDEPLIATLQARPNEAMCRQAILLRRSETVEFSRNSLRDPGGHTQIDDRSGSRMVGLFETHSIVIDGRSVPETVIP